MYRLLQLSSWLLPVLGESSRQPHYAFGALGHLGHSRGALGALTWGTWGTHIAYKDKYTKKVGHSFYSYLLAVIELKFCQTAVFVFTL